LTETSSSRERLLEKKLEKLEQTLDLVLKETLSKNRRGKAKNLNSGGLLSRLRGSFSKGQGPSQEGSDQASTSSAHSQDDRGSPPPYSATAEEEDDQEFFVPVGDKVDAKVWVQKVELLLNGAPLGIFVQLFLWCITSTLN